MDSKQSRLPLGAFLLGILALLLLLALPARQALSATVQLHNDNGQAHGYSATAQICRVFGSVLQADAGQYPLQVMSVDFYLYPFNGAASSVQVRAVVYALDPDGTPGNLLGRSDPVTISTFYPTWVSVPLPGQVLVSGPEGFFVGVQYEAGAEGTTPSILSDSSTNIPVGRNFYSQTCGGSWFEHYDWWQDPANVGYNIVRATVETNMPPTATWTPTFTPTPGPSPTPIPGQVGPGEMAGAMKQHVLARDAENRVHLVYAAPLRKELYHVWSADDGLTWQPAPPLVAATSDEIEAALASDLDGYLHLVYGPWDGQEAYYKTYDGSGWGTETQIGDWVFGRNVAVDSSGAVHAVWSNSNVWYTRLDGGAWSTPQQIASAGWHPAFVVGPDATLHVAYNDAAYCCDADYVEVRYIFSADGGQTWSSPQNVSGDDVWSGGAALAASPDGTVHLTYISLSPVVEGALYYRQKKDGPWSPADVISSGNAGVRTGSTGSDSAAMAVDDLGDLLVLFRCLNQADQWDICLRIRDWQGWLPVMNLTNNVGINSDGPSVGYGVIPAGQGLDAAWRSYAYVVYQYLPREQWSLRPTPTPTPTATPTPGAYHARIVDVGDQPVDGARVYHNGSLVTDTEGRPLLTSFGGVLNFDSLQPGDTLAALALQAQTATVRDGHALDPDPRYPDQAWAYRVYLTSLGIDDQGSVVLYRVPEPAAGEHRLVVEREQPLVLLNVVASIEWDATISYTIEISRAFGLVSDYLYDLSDGQVALGQVEIYDQGAYWTDADVQISARNVVHPHAYVGGITSTDKSYVIRVGRAWDGNSGNQGSWDEPAGYRTLAHEFGHYALYLYDEYFAYAFDSQGNLTGEVPAWCTGPENRNPVWETTNASAMDYHYTSSELSARGVAGLWSSLCETTAQMQLNGESCWETMVRRYTDPAVPARWQLVSPGERGGLLTGPAGLSSALPSLPAITVHQAGPSAPARRLTVYHPGGGGYWGAIVALYRFDGQVIGQGFTDQNGQLEVYGAAEGDTLRAASFDGGLAGSASVPAESSVNLTLAPVAASARRAAGNPFIRLRAEPSGQAGWVDLFVSLYNFGPGADPTVLVSEPGGGSSQAFTVSYSPETGTYQGEIALEATSYALANLRAVGEVDGRLVRLHVTYRLQQVLNSKSSDVHASDGNVSLHLDSGSLPGNSAYLAIMPPGAAPGPLPEGWVLVGDPYDVTASGAVVALEKPAVLKLRYDTMLLLPSLALDQLAIHRWDPNDGTWHPVPGTVDAGQQAVSAPITTLGTYALLAQEATSERVFLPVVLRNSWR